MQGCLQEPFQELPSCRPYITYIKISAKNIHQFIEAHQKMNPKQHELIFFSPFQMSRSRSQPTTVSIAMCMITKAMHAASNINQLKHE